MGELGWWKREEEGRLGTIISIGKWEPHLQAQPSE